MMDLEQQLKQALNRKPAPPRFTDRVLSAAHHRSARRWRAIAAAVTLTASLGAWTAHDIAERRAGEHARQQVLLAMRITSEKVHYAQTQVHEIGSRR